MNSQGGLPELSFARIIKRARACSVCVINDNNAMQSAMPTAHHAAASLMPRVNQTKSAFVFVKGATMATRNTQVKRMQSFCTCQQAQVKRGKGKGSVLHCVFRALHFV
jgi:hypothetical protein